MKVKFGIDKEEDKIVVPMFMDRESVAGADFAEDAVFKYHPGLRNLENTEDVDNYIDKYYKTHEAEMHGKLKRFKEEWNRVEQKSYEVLEAYFPGTNIGKEDASAILTIIGVCPRWIEMRRFMIFYKANTCIGTVLHELMHFYFFEYCDKFHKELVKDLSKESPSPYWHLSEIINNVLFKTPEVLKLLNGEEDSPYLEHEVIFEEVNNVWLESKDIDKLIIDGFKIVNKWITNL